MPVSQANKSKNLKSSNRDRRSRSRNSTPLSSGPETSILSAPPTGDSDYLHTPLSALIVESHRSIEGLIEKHSATTTNGNPPSAASLNSLHDGIVSEVLADVTARGLACDKAMRELSRKRKERIEAERERDERERMDEERRKRDNKKLIGKKRDREEVEDKTRPPAVGARGLAPQDGVDVHMDDASPLVPPPAQVAKTDAAGDDAESPSNASETSQQPPKAHAIAHYETFGDDPTKFDDPTIYDIRDLTPDMTDEEKKAILCVAEFPHDDLHDLTPGTPPDNDFSVAKPTNQVAFGTFQAYVEPYIRHLTEEDVGFLKERGDRLEPYVMPARGPMHYREVWAREDGLNPRDSMNDHQPLNEPRGSIEDMNDDTAATEDVSSGPLLARLLAALRHEPSNNQNGDATDANGDTTMTNGDATAGDQDPLGNNHNEDNDSTKPPTYFPDLSNPARSTTTATRSYGQLEQRMLQELRYHGLLTPEATPDYDGHFDDEVAARLRYLQSELRAVSAENGARKTRVLELTEERMAMQEYNTIADDLDNQINAAYTKRNRTMSKPKKGVGKARPGQAATGVATSRNTVSDGVKMLMERRQQWKDLIGPVVDFGQWGIPKDTVFDKDTMERFMKTEGEAAEADEA